VAWVVSSEKAPSAKLVDACVKFQQNGHGLALWADNFPYVATVNPILAKVSKLQVSGNTPGNKVLNVNKRETLSKKGEFKRHLLTSGITNLFEGITLCHPTEPYEMENFSILATSTDGKPCLMCSDYSSGLPAEQGRIVLDCGFTKLYHNFDTAGTGRYIRNVCVWLLALDHRLAIGAEIQGDIPKTLAKKAHHTKEKKKRTTKVSKKTKRPSKKRKTEKEKEKEDEADDSELKWVWQYWHNGWYNYDTAANDVVESVYQDYLQNPRNCDVRAVSSGDWKYMVDFRALTQQNIQHESHTTRNIRRVQIPSSDLVLDHKKRYL